MSVCEVFFFSSARNSCQRIMLLKAAFVGFFCASESRHSAHHLSNPEPSDGSFPAILAAEETK